MKNPTRPNTISEDAAYTEIQSILPAADRIRFAALRLTGALSTARKKSLLRQEKAVVASEGPASPAAKRFRRRLEIEERFAAAVRAEQQRGAVEPVQRNPQALILRGRVVDARRLGLPRLTVSAINTQGQPAASTVSSETGYFEVLVPAKNREAPETVFLLVNDSARNILYRGCEGFVVRADAVVTRELMLSAGERIPQPTPPPDLDPQRVTVPDVQGLRQHDAELQLTALCLKPAVVTKATSGDQTGRILNQNPEPGASVSLASIVTLTVGVAATTLAVPDLIGLHQEKAAAQLKASGLAVGTVEFEPAEGDRVGTVIRQSPEAGAQATPGSAVNLIVGKELEVENPSPQPGSVEVPQLVERRLAEAEKLLKKARLKRGKVSPRDATDASMVIRQKPVAGTRVNEGTAVDLEAAPGTGGSRRPVAPQRVTATKRASRKKATVKIAARPAD